MKCKRKSPLKDIRDHCLECMGGSPKEVAECPSKEYCHLWPYRFGKNPFRTKRKLTDEQKEELANNLKKAREAKQNE